MEFVKIRVKMKWTSYSCYIYCTAEEPWCPDTKLYQPYEAEQILLAENASCLAVKAYLNVSYCYMLSKQSKSDTFYSFNYNIYELNSTTIVYANSDVQFALHNRTM